MTADHLILGGSCNSLSLSLVQVGSLKVGECVQTISGAQTVASVSAVESHGIYTVVTQHDGLLIVNGIVSSPFAVNHLVANSFYNILRVVHRVFPSIIKASFTPLVIKTFGDIFTSAFA